MRSGRGVGLAMLMMAASACGLRGPSPDEARRYDEASFARKRLPSWTIATPVPGSDHDTVVGAVQTVTIRPGDTLLDLARLYDLGFEEIAQANPGVDAWVPAVGTEVVVPTAFVLPCCSYDGLVINIPELRAYFYHPGPRAGTTVVETFPLGLGRSEAPTPLGVFRVKGKTVNPGWGVPAKIRLEHLRERGDGRSFIAGGSPDNPLGKYRLELDRTLYRIHGTNQPWGIGRLVSHGCAQLYPEDIAHLFPLVPIGTRVEFVYQTVKVGRRDGETWVEVQPDVYDRGEQPFDQALHAVRAQRVSADPGRLRAALRVDGVPRPLEEPGWLHWPKLL